MKTLRAVNTIIMTLEPGKNGDKMRNLPPERPKSVTIQPRTRFKAQNQEQEDDLLAQGAAIIAGDPVDDDVKETTIVKPVKPTTKAKAPTKANVAKGEVNDVLDRDADDDIDVDGDNLDADGDEDLV